MVAEHAKVVESLQSAAADRAQSMHALRAELEGQIAELRESHLAAVHGIESSSEAKLAAQASTFEAQLTAITQTGSDQDEQSRNALSALTVAAEERAKAFETQCEEHKCALELLTEQGRQATLEAKERFASELAITETQAHASTEAQLSSLESSHDETEAGLRSELTQARDEHAASLSAAASEREAHSRELEAYTAEAQAAQHAATQEHESAASVKADAYAAELQSMRDEIESLCTLQADALESLHEAHREELRRYSSDKETTVSDVTTRHMAELESMRSTMAAQTVAFEAQREEHAHALAASATDLERQHEESETARAALATEHSAVVHWHREVHETKLAEVHAEVSLERTASEMKVVDLEKKMEAHLSRQSTLT